MVGLADESHQSIEMEPFLAVDETDCICKGRVLCLCRNTGGFPPYRLPDTRHQRVLDCQKQQCLRRAIGSQDQSVPFVLLEALG